MYLNIILTILVIVLITITVLLTRWWRNYGKELFKSSVDIRKLTSGLNPNFGPQIKSMKEMLDNVRKTRKPFGNFKR